MAANGRLTVLLRRSKNQHGVYHIGNSDFPGTISIDEVIIKAFSQDDGSLLLVFEKDTKPDKQGPVRGIRQV